jgi:hypothetical protein
MGFIRNDAAKPAAKNSKGRVQRECRLMLSLARSVIGKLALTRPVVRGSPKSRVPVSPILALPVEIMEHILPHLSRPERALLGLTCRSFHHFIRARSGPPTLYDCEGFLDIIQTDCPKLFYCHACVRMHPFRRVFGPIGYSSRRFCSPRELSFCSGRSRFLQGLDLTIPEEPIENLRKLLTSGYREFGGDGYPTGNRDYMLAFHHVQLVMNGHFLGPRHGLPPDISTGHVSRTTNSGLTMGQWWRSRIIAEELYPSATHVYAHSENFVQMRRDLNDLHGGGNGICSHLGTRYWALPTSIPELNCCDRPIVHRISVDETICLSASFHRVQQLAWLVFLLSNGLRDHNQERRAKINNHNCHLPPARFLSVAR